VEERRQDLLALLMPITRQLRDIEEAAAARHGLSMWQYAILSVVDRRAGLNQGDVADRLGYSKNRIVADLDHLELGGLLSRRRATDRRANVLTITSRGRRIMTQVQTEIHHDEDELLAALPPASRRTFAAQLGALNEQVRSRRRSRGGGTMSPARPTQPAGSGVRSTDG
jgi:DNA-binding MarR family transcriptional regulator